MGCSESVQNRAVEQFCARLRGVGRVTEYQKDFKTLKIIKIIQKIYITILSRLENKQFKNISNLGSSFTLQYIFFSQILKSFECFMSEKVVFNLTAE